MRLVVQMINFWVYFTLTFSAGTTGAERGGTGADWEAGSRVEEHPGSDGEKDTQSWKCRQTGGEAQGRVAPVDEQNDFPPLCAFMNHWQRLMFLLSLSLLPLCVLAGRLWHDGQRARLWDEGSALGEDENPGGARPRGEGEAAETRGMFTVQGNISVSMQTTSCRYHIRYFYLSIIIFRMLHLIVDFLHSVLSPGGPSEEDDGSWSWRQCTESHPHVCRWPQRWLHSG